MSQLTGLWKSRSGRSHWISNGNALPAAHGVVAAGKRSSTGDCHFQLYRIIRSVSQILLRPEVSLRSLDRRMSEQQLNLLQFPTSSPAQL
ncbi:MAG: hypothetical protein QOJ99_172, partial [Bryobacterales bacterium]|nr:hypothetical protein [Bryobacterales bacterium]